MNSTKSGNKGERVLGFRIEQIDIIPMMLGVIFLIL